MVNMEKEIKPTDSKERFKINIENVISEKRPWIISSEDMKFLNESFSESGVDLDVISNPEIAYSWLAPQFRTKVEVDEDDNPVGVMIYDRRKPEGEKWAPLTSDVEPDAFKELSQKINQSKFQDRTFAVLKILGMEKFKKLVIWSYQKGKEMGLPRLVQKDEQTGEKKIREQTQGRGIMQTAADIVTLAVLNTLLDIEDNTADEYKQKEGENSWKHLAYRRFSRQDYSEKLVWLQERINLRMYKWWLKKANSETERTEITNKFNSVCPELPTKTTTSFPPELLPELISLLSS
jgi:hypothetical protein